MSFCAEGGIPVTGSSFPLSCSIVHDGVIRRSEFGPEFSEEILRGMSPAVWRLMAWWESFKSTQGPSCARSDA